MKLSDLLNLERARILMTGNPRRLAGIFLKVWSGKGYRILAEWLPFAVEGNVFIGDPLTTPGFDAYLLLNPISRPKAEKEALYRWLDGMREGLVLLYETKYVGDSIARYRIRNFIDYLIAYKRETVGAEIVNLYRLEDGRVVEKKTFIKRGL